MGYASGSGNSGQADYSFSIGTWDGATFSTLQTATGENVSYQGNFLSNDANTTTVSLIYAAPATVGGDSIAITWATSGNFPFNNGSQITAFFGFDNVILSTSAVPEPATTAAILGGLALFGVACRRRRYRTLSI